MAVHRELGNGFLEPVYQEAFARECARHSIPTEREVELGIKFSGEPLSVKYRPDFIAYGAIIVELKVVSKLNDAHVSQVVHYMKAAGFKLSLLLNFGSESLERRRLINSCSPGSFSEIWVPPA